VFLFADFIRTMYANVFAAHFVSTVEVILYLLKRKSNKIL